jgi:hypothetical protein
VKSIGRDRCEHSAKIRHSMLRYAPERIAGLIPPSHHPHRVSTYEKDSCN